MTVPLSTCLYNFNIFFTSLASLANTNETTDNALVSTDGVEKIEALLQNNRFWIAHSDTRTIGALRSLAERISAAGEHNGCSIKATKLMKSLKEAADFNEALNQWLKDKTISGEKKWAAEEIKAAWIKRSSTLDLSCLAISKLPSCIGQLTQLTKLNLWNNKLTSLPETIGQLTRLKRLYLSYNKLTSLPEAIGQLTRLKKLELSYNKLTSLPEAIGQLTQLTELYPSCNKLTSLPEAIGQLTQLTRLSLCNNELISLPEALGRLQRLEWLDISKNDISHLPVAIGLLTRLNALYAENNTHLEELPMSLGQIPQLTDLDVSGTQVPWRNHNAILVACRALRDAKANEKLPERLNLWIRVAGKKEGERHTSLASLTEVQRATLNEWLLRLEKTSDFRNDQRRLAKIVCGILSSVVVDKEFADFFFAQAEANNECCQDRAAMSLNEIYTYWCICYPPKSLSLTDKLQLIISAAKTFTLRALLNKLIDARQKESSRIEGESVEIYLYYETALRQRLNLLSAIEKMAYEQMGRRQWIDVDALAVQVEVCYREEITAQPAFVAVTEQESSFKEVWQPHQSSFDKEMDEMTEALYNPDAIHTSEQINQRMNELKQKRDNGWKNTALQWLDQQMVGSESKTLF